MEDLLVLIEMERLLKVDVLFVVQEVQEILQEVEYYLLTEQFDDRKEMMEKKWKDGKYIAYFQAYTNTYAPVEELRKKYEEALAQENVVALSIATRPDCLR